MGGASGVAEGAAAPLPCALCPAPVVVISVCPLDPSRPLSQSKVYVKIHEMCQNTA